MSFIGYNQQGFEQLTAAIGNAKNNILNVLDSFSEVEVAIADCWKGEDATEYSEELKNVIATTKTTVTEIYDELLTSCKNTYNDWVNKQK